MLGNQIDPAHIKKIFNLKTSSQRFVQKIEMGDFPNSCFCARYDSSDKYVATGYGDGAVRVYNT